MISNTKTCYVDANVLVYYKNESSPFHTQTISLIEDLVRKGFTIFISPLTLDEYLHVFLLYTRQKKEQNLKDFLGNYLRSILEIPRLKIINSPDDKLSQFHIVEFMDEYFLRPRDAYHLLIMKTNKLKYFATFDNDFKKVFEAKMLVQYREAPRA